MTTDWNEKEVFLEAVSLHESEREGFLASACPNDAARDRIRRLIGFHAESTRTAPSGITRPETPPEDLPGQIEEFTIERRLGEGGMGVVYLAQDTLLGRRVALKVLATHLVRSDAAIQRFYEEARSTAILQHPAIVPIYKFGFDGTRHYIAIEYVDGPTLKTVIQDEIVSRDDEMERHDFREWQRRAAEVIAVVADALDSAHRVNIVHRDVKPSNILVDPERGPRLTDFGIALNPNEPGDASTGSTIIGSCHYMSPEQASIAETSVDQRSDIFSLGVVLYEMLALKRPFGGDTVAEVLREITDVEPPHLRTLNRQISRDLETICDKALAKDPDDRYPTAAHFAADLRCYLEGKPILARPPTIVHRTRRWIHAHKRRLIAALVLLALLIGVQQGVSYRNRTGLWVMIENGPAGCDVVFQAIDPTTWEPDPTGVRLGHTPMRAQRIQVQVGRVTIVAPDGARFAEVDIMDPAAGRDNMMHIVVIEPENAKSVVTDAIGSPRTVFARLLNPADVRHEMLEIEAGVYPFGYDENPEQTSNLIRSRNVSLTGYLFDHTEVSNRQYHAFIEATGHRIPINWPNGQYDPAAGNRPVMGIRPTDAAAYASWAGKRLPTAQEWQAATRGREGRLYPWGREADPEASRLPWTEHHENAMKTDNIEALYSEYISNTSDVHEPRALTTIGPLQHVFGNVQELTSTLDDEPALWVLAGRSWTMSPTRTHLASGINCYYNDPGVIHASFEVGFRCAKSVSLPLCLTINDE